MKKQGTCGVYKIISPSDKVYIGESKNIEERWKSYRSLDCKSQTRLFNSLLKHGWENHSFEIIEVCDFEKLKIRERYYQDEYDVINEKGLNCILTGWEEQKTVYSEDFLERKRVNMLGSLNPMFGLLKEDNPNFGSKRTEEAKQNMSDNHARLSGENHHLFGKKSPWLSLRNRTNEGVFAGGNNPNAGKTINVITLKIFNSAKEAHKEGNVEFPYRYFTSMLRAKNKNQTDYMYLKDYEKGGVVKKHVAKAWNQEVENIDTGEKYSSKRAAALSYGISYTTLVDYLNGRAPNKTPLRLTVK